MKLSEISLQKQLEQFEVEGDILSTLESVRGREAYCTLTILRNLQIAVQFINAVAEEFTPESRAAFAVYGNKLLANTIPPIMELAHLPREEQLEVMRLFDKIREGRS